MRPGVVQLRQFYSSKLGHRVKQRLRQVALTHWPEFEEETVIGVGYAPPILRAMERTAGKSKPIALMPADQGAIYWPIHTDNRSVLGDEIMPPFTPNTLQRVILVHAFEFQDRPHELLAVYWDMLAPGGRLLLLVPNRVGLWKHLGHTPFRRGQAYSMGQLRDLLYDAQFTLRESSHALFAWPSAHPIAMRLFGVLEWLGRFLWPGLGGLLVIEAEKQIYAGLAVPVTRVKEAAWAGTPAIAGTNRV